MLPDGDGVELCRRLREWTQAPIIVLSAVGEEADKVRALDGADDYVVKPFAPRELVARLEAILPSLREPRRRTRLTAGVLEVDLAEHAVRVEGESVHLTPKEFELLRALLRHRGRLLTHGALLVEVWGPAYSDEVGVLRSHMANLRRKLGTAGSLIETELGLGYRFSA